MAAIYENTDHIQIRMKYDKQPTSAAEADYNIYANNDNVDWNPKTQDFADVSKCAFESEKEKGASNKRVFMVGLCIFLLTALGALCVIGVLYSKQIERNGWLKEQYSTAEADLDAQKQNATELRRDFNQLQVSLREMEKSYQELKAKHDSCKLPDKTVGRKKYYYFSTEKLNWMQSRDYCVKTGGQLVIIRGKEDQDYLSSDLKESHWIGLNDLKTEGHWMWVDNTPLTGETFWFTRPDVPNEPDNWKHEDPDGENCASLGNESNNSFKWYDSSCSKLKKFICEK